VPEQCCGTHRHDPETKREEMSLCHPQDLFLRLLKETRIYTKIAYPNSSSVLLKDI
jgi:hypothetical protein